MSPSSRIPTDCKHSGCVPGKLWSARHSQHGCRLARGMGAVPLAPRGAAPNPASTVIAPSPGAVPSQPSPASVMAVLTTFEGQAVFRIVASDAIGLRTGDIFRLRKGSRTCAAPRVQP